MSLDYAKCENNPELMPEFTPDAAALLDRAEKQAATLVRQTLAVFLQSSDADRLAMAMKYAYALNMAEAYFADASGGAEAMRRKDEGLLVLSEAVDRAGAWVELACADDASVVFDT
ncbi:MAG: hypothetical protein ABIF28_17715 [Pseudomonadota bacterium]